jgi:hypothetical protein
MNPAGRIEVQAKVARHGEDGVGLAFVLPDDPDSRKWESLRESLIEKAQPEDMRELVRMAAAIEFLSRLCPKGAEKIGQLLGGELSNDRLANTVPIALRAESLLGIEAITGKLRADPDLVVRVLEDGSSADEDWLKNFWAGLLATACAADGKHESSPVFVELLARLTTFPVRILTVLCTRATKVLAESGSISAEPLACKIEELMLTTGSRGLQLERDLECLSELRLIERRDPNLPALATCEKADITPSGLGLELFARCNGHRGSLRDFYAADSR